MTLGIAIQMLHHPKLQLFKKCGYLSVAGIQKNTVIREMQLLWLEYDCLSPRQSIPKKLPY
jgi:hypothetical protein